MGLGAYVLGAIVIAAAAEVAAEQAGKLNQKILMPCYPFFWTVFVVERLAPNDGLVGVGSYWKGLPCTS